MAHKKKLQVFISSTYTDLREVRQAAVEAILTAGHIPAGMELFAAGDESQMDVIKRWIDESDVFLLILGGRYGSIDAKSQISYIEIEYKYALANRKPFFALVVEENYLDEIARSHGLKFIEQDHPDKLRAFRDLVCSKIVRFWSDSRDIQLEIVKKMAELSERSDLIGWVSGSEAIKSNNMADELTRLSKENAILREQMENVRSSISATMPNPEEANSFLRNIYNAFMQIGGGSYVPLDTLKRHLSGIYSDNLFDSLLIEARTKNPDKVWIDKAIDKDRQVQTTIVKIKEL